MCCCCGVLQPRDDVVSNSCCWKQTNDHGAVCLEATKKFMIQLLNWLNLFDWISVLICFNIVQTLSKNQNSRPSVQFGSRGLFPCHGVTRGYMWRTYTTWATSLNDLFTCFSLGALGEYCSCRWSRKEAEISNIPTARGWDSVKLLVFLFSVIRLPAPFWYVSQLLKVVL